MTFYDDINSTLRHNAIVIILDMEQQLTTLFSPLVSDYYKDVKELYIDMHGILPDILSPFLFLTDEEPVS